MMLMHLKKLILLLLAMVWLVPCKANTPSSTTANLVDKTCAERPQWSDMGMYDLLAAPGTASLTPPTTVRIASNSPSATVFVGGIHHRIYASAIIKPLAHPEHTHRGYIYLLRCLRL